MLIFSELRKILAQALKILETGDICFNCVSTIEWQLTGYYYFKRRYTPLKPTPEEISTNPSIRTLLEKNHQVIYHLIHFLDESLYKIRQRKSWVHKNYYKNSYWTPLKNYFLEILSELHCVPQTFSHETLSERAIELKINSFRRIFYNRILSLLDIINCHQKELEKSVSLVDIAYCDQKELEKSNFDCCCEQNIVLAKNHEGSKTDTKMWASRI